MAFVLLAAFFLTSTGILVGAAISPPAQRSESGSMAAGSTVPQSTQELAGRYVVSRQDAQPQ